MEKMKRRLAREAKQIEEDFAFYNKNTELLAAWIIFYTFFATVFFYSLTHGFSAIIIVNALSFIVGMLVVAGTIVYLDVVEQEKSRKLVAFHRLVNKSFRISLPRLRLEMPEFKKFRLSYK